MGFEKLVLFGVMAFGFMALAQMLRSFYEARKAAGRKKKRRYRRKVGSNLVAEDIARGLIAELMEKYPTEVTEARKSGSIPPKLEKALESAKDHYLNRVSGAHRGYFYKLIRELILERNLDKMD